MAGIGFHTNFTAQSIYYRVVPIEIEAMRTYNEYTFQGQLLLGNYLRDIRQQVKPTWRPDPSFNLDKEEIVAEQTEYWSLETMAAIINREYNLPQPGAPAVNDDQIHRTECPRPSTREPNTRLLELLAGLNIYINPRTKQPYTAEDLRRVAKEILDPYTGHDLIKPNNKKRRRAAV